MSSKLSELEARDRYAEPGWARNVVEEILVADRRYLLGLVREIRKGLERIEQAKSYHSVSELSDWARALLDRLEE